MEQVTMKVSELLYKLPTAVVKFGLSKSLTDNPALSSAIVDIKKSIKELNLDDNQILVIDTENNKFSFRYETPSETGRVSVSSRIDSEIEMVISRETNYGYSERLGRGFRSKSVANKLIQLHNDNLVIKHNTINVNDMNIFDKGLKATISNRTKIYDENGIMTYYEDVVLDDEIDYKPYDLLSIEDMILLSDVSRRESLPKDSKIYRRLERDTIDTAKLEYKNETEGVKVYSTVQLKHEPTLRNMIPVIPFKEMKPDKVDFSIPEASPDEIASWIIKEENPKVLDGLKKYVERRLGYSYNPNEDMLFVCESIIDRNQRRY